MTIKKALLGALVLVASNSIALSSELEQMLAECRRIPTQPFCYPENFLDKKQAPTASLKSPKRIEIDETTGIDWDSTTIYYLSNRERLYTRIGEKPHTRQATLFGTVRVLRDGKNTDTGELRQDHGLSSSKTPVLDPKPLTEHDLIALLQGRLPSLTHGLTVYVHGIRNNFADAARDAAKLKGGLAPEREVIFYSWPAEVFGTSVSPFSRNFPIYFAQGYKRTRRMVDQSVSVLSDFLHDAMSVGATSISIYAHSMGSRLTALALESLAQTASIELGSLHNIALVAADLSTQEFSILENQLDSSKRPSNLIVYCHAFDWALWAGQQYDGNRRVGQCFGDKDLQRGSFVTVFRVDRRSDADPDEDAFRHSYQSTEPVLSHATKHLSQPLGQGRMHLKGHRQAVSDVLLGVERPSGPLVAAPGAP